MKKSYLLVSLIFLIHKVYALPENFVYLHQVDPTIQLEIRYAGKHNFVGRKAKGYEKPVCILTKQAAEALSKVQKELAQSSLSLKVYDCYRPAMAVEDFVAWSKLPHHIEMKDEFYPQLSKEDLFVEGYIANQSGHSRGSTVDLTIVPLPFLPSEKYRPGQKLISCTAPYLKRFRDNSIDMGTGYDCMDKLSNPLNEEISTVPYHNRMLLRAVMEKYRFVPFEKEWWHFTLKDEPYPETYFNFLVV